MNRVINFHDISDGVWFEKLLLMLSAKYNMVSIKEIENYFYNSGPLRNACHLTFDDGDKSFYNIVYPILKKHNIPATIFVSSKMCSEGKNFWFQEISGFDPDKLKDVISNEFSIKRDLLVKPSVFSILKCLKIEQIRQVINEYQLKFNVVPALAFNLSIDQLIEIDREGLVTIGAHTINHPILANESDDICESEIIDSLSGLEKILGYRIRYFAFPNGWTELDYGEREIRILQQNGVRIAFACTPGYYSLKNIPLAIKRYNLSYANLVFIWTKLSLGEFWEFMKNQVRSGEVDDRKMIYKALKSSKKPSGL